MDPVRLAIDVGPLYGHRTGVGTGVAELVRVLTGHPGVELRPYLLSMRTRPEPPVRRLPLPAAAAIRAWSRLDHPRVDRWLGGAEVVHGTNFVVPPSLRPALVTVHDCWFLAHPDAASPVVRRAGDVLRRRVRAGATVHAVSHATAEAVSALLGASDIEVVHQGPPPAHAPPAHAPAPWLADLAGRPFVLAVGTVERRKNLPALATAFGDAAVDGTALVIAGAPGDDSTALDSAVDQLDRDARSRVIRPGPVGDDEKAWLLHNATALAYPSLDEGFGFPIIEAQTAGVPVVATRAGAIPEIAGDGAELVPVGDRDALAVALTRVCADEDRRAELIEAGRKNVTRFSWEATAEALVGVYRRLAQR